MEKTIFSIIIFLTFIFYNCERFSFKKDISGLSLKHDKINDTASINALNMLSRTFRNLSLEKSWNYAIQANKASKISSYQFGLAKSLSNMGAILLQKGYTLQALNCYEEALDIFILIHLKKDIANTLNNIGAVYEKQNELDEAAVYYIKALEIYHKLQEQNGIIGCKNNIGNIYFKQENLNAALKCYNDALKIKEKLKDSLIISQTYRNIGEVYLKNNETEKALNNFKQCLTIDEKMHDSVNLAATLSSMGNVYLQKRDFNLAQKYFFTALLISRNRNDTLLMIDHFNNLGILFFIKNENENALKYYDSARVISENFDYSDKLEKTYKHIFEIYESQNNPLIALHYHKLYTRQLQKRMKGNNIPEAVANFDIKQREERITDLKQLHEKDKINLIILSFLFIIFIISTFFIYNRYKLKQKIILERTISDLEKLRFKVVIEAQDLERKRIAGDLHDSLGSMLSIAKLHLSGLEDFIKKNSSEGKKYFTTATGLIDNACNEVRSISHNLMPTALIKFGLLEGIEELINKINESHQVKISLEVKGFINRLDEVFEIPLFRIIQELTQNIIKHSNATNANILFKQEKEVISIVVSDNGKGMDINAIEKNQGIGWKNIYSRIQMIKGNVNIDSQKGKGTTIKIEFKIN